MLKLNKNKNLLGSILILTFMLGAVIAPSFYVWAEISSTDAGDELNQLYDEISDKKKEIGEIENQISQFKSAIRDKQQQKSNLTNQLEILDDQITKTELEVEKIKIQINQIELEIQVNETNIANTTNQISKLRQQMAELIRTMNIHDDKSYLEVVVLYSSLSDFFDELTYLETLEGDLKLSLEQVKVLKQELDQENYNLNQRQKKLVDIHKELNEKKLDLETNQTTKNYLLDQTRRDEQRYQQLLSEEKALYEKMNSEIAYLEKTIRAKMAETGQLGDISKSGLIWPVPSKEITAYFHDPDYPYRNIFEHPAIDIRAQQGTAVRAAASGYVARAKDNGFGYNYIMIVHDQGISTVYGHISKILVEEDTYVVQGQTLALSGGTPGTLGAGRLTTGPHLHFEIRLNGIPVNPLNYLSY